ncbi:MAG: AMP-binding protein, partial [bacterium]|nr:AMP-binding protein [bacterium]
ANIQSHLKKAVNKVKIEQKRVQERKTDASGLSRSKRYKQDLKHLEKIRISEFKYQKEYIAPRDRQEEKLAEIWTGILGTGEERIGIDDNFFQVGGHSLSATTLVNRVYKEFKINLDVADVFTAPTIRQMAQKIKKQETMAYSEILPVPEQEHYELSNAQRRLWVLCQFDTETTAYNMPNAIMLEGPFKAGVFKRAGQTVAERHEALRTVFVIENGEPTQKVLKEFKFELRQTELRGTDEKEKEEQARKIYLENANSAFNLEKGPLFFFRQLRLEEEKSLLIFNTHHIVSDGWSHGIIFNEIITLYNSYHQGEPNHFTPLTLQYKDYSHWHNQQGRTGGFENSQRYWLEKFKDKPNGIQLPLDHPRQTIQTFNGGRVRFEINEERTAQLRQISHKEDVTIFMSLLTQLSIYLYRNTGQEDILLGAPVANRNRPELTAIVGFMVNTLVYRNQITPGENFKQILAKVKKEALESYRNQDYPFDQLVERLELDRDLTQTPLFNVMMAQNNTETMNTGLEMEGITTTDYLFNDDFNMSKFDLLFFMDETEKSISNRIEYNSDLFERATIERMSANFLTMVDSVIEDGGKPLSRLKIISPAETKQIIRTFNHTEKNYLPLTLMQQFENQVEKNPQKTVVALEEEKITYRRLNEKINRIAHYLKEENHIKAGEIVGISIDRSVDMITVILGVIKAGAGYMAVDPTYPPERIAYMLADSNIRVLITGKANQLETTGHTGNEMEIIDITAQRDAINTKKNTNPENVNTPAHIMYLTYTSGSTGTPNGAIVTHATLTNLVQWQNHETTIEASGRTLQFASVNFDVSFQEIMTTLTSGGELYLIDEMQRKDMDSLMDYLITYKIEILYLPFYYLDYLFTQSDRWGETYPHKLKHIVT